MSILSKVLSRRFYFSIIATSRAFKYFSLFFTLVKMRKTIFPCNFPVWQGFFKALRLSWSVSTTYFFIIHDFYFEVAHCCNSKIKLLKKSRNHSKVVLFYLSLHELFYSPHKMVKHTQTISRQTGDELFECVWPFCGVSA